MTATLYDLSAEIRAILDRADERDGEITLEDLAELEKLTPKLEDKAEVYCRLIRWDETRIVALKAEQDRLQAAIATADRHKTRYKERLKMCMELAGQTRIETPLFKVGIYRNSNASVTCHGTPEDLPTHLQKVKIEPDNQKAKEIWTETGKAPEGFDIKIGSHIRIK